MLDEEVGSVGGCSVGQEWLQVVQYISYALREARATPRPSGYLHCKVGHDSIGGLDVMAAVTLRRSLK